VKLKKIVSILLILGGGILLIIELTATKKNYYVQTAGIICLMSGVFLVNTNVSSKSINDTQDTSENYQEEE